MRYLIPTLILLAGCPSESAFVEQTNHDTWQQAATNEVDILWVVDNSGSMEQEQTTLAQGFGSFVANMEESATDFHIGLITTSFDYDDPDRGKLIGDPPVITTSDDYETLFENRVRVGITGSDKEKGLEAAAYALSPTMQLGPNIGFLRKDAQLLVVFVSDEEDCSDNGALESEPSKACYEDKNKLVPVGSYVTEFRDLKVDDSMVQIGAIVAQSNSSCTAENAEGTRYMTVAALTGGLIGDICETDWSGMMGDLGLNASGVHSSFQLSKAALPETLKVFVDLEEVKTGWTYDPDTWYITFDEASVPPRGATVEADYTVDPGVREPAEAADL